MKGDVLASGGTQAQFPTTNGEISQEKWDDIFADFDAEAYRRDAGSYDKHS